MQGEPFGCSGLVQDWVLGSQTPARWHWSSAVQAAMHFPSQQTCPGLQTVPQAPQLVTSLLRSLQTPPQQAGVVPLQTSLHAPQLPTSLCRLAQVALLQQVGWVAGQQNAPWVLTAQTSGCPAGAAGPQLKQGPVPWAASLVHLPRLPPGGKVAVQK